MSFYYRQYIIFIVLSDVPNAGPKEETEEDKVNNIIANLENSKSKDSGDNSYGEEYYGNPFTNVDYTETTGEINIDKLLYNVVSEGAANKPLVNSYQSLPNVYDGYSVITDVFEVRNLAVDALIGLSAPQYYSEPGYLVSFILAVNDPLMAMKVFIKGLGENGYNLADYTMEQMTTLGLGMTYGEAYELIYTDEGQTSRDLSGQTSTEFPYIVRFKHLPTGKETDYELYKGTKDDAWIVAAFTPKLYPKFNSMYFDVYNSNPSGTRLIHYMQIKRYIIMDIKKMSSKPDYTKSILNVDTSQVVSDLIGTGESVGGELEEELLNASPVAGNSPTSINPDIAIPQVTPAAASSSYTSLNGRKIRTGHIKRNQNQNILFNNPSKNLYSLNTEQQGNKIFQDYVNEQQKISNDLTKYKYKKMGNLKKLG